MLSRQFLVLSAVCALYVCVWFLTPLPTLLYNSSAFSKEYEVLPLPPRINEFTRPPTPQPTTPLPSSPNEQPSTPKEQPSTPTVAPIQTPTPNEKPSTPTTLTTPTIPTTPSTTPTNPQDQVKPTTPILDSTSKPIGDNTSKPSGVPTNAPTEAVDEWRASIPTEKPIEHPDELNKSPTKASTKPLGGSMIPYKSLPIGVITHRPKLLMRLMENMENSAEFIDMRNVFILEDGNTAATTETIEKYHATRVTCTGQVAGIGGLNGNYQCLMDFIYTNTKFDAFIFLEEDLILAPDFYSYFLTLVPILRVDPSVFCVSTWSDNGYQVYARDTDAVIRQEHFGGYGWAISRKLYEEEIRGVKWGSSSSRMWDQYMQDLTRDRVCLAPEVARTHHDSGSTGATISQQAQISSFDNIRLSNVQKADLKPAFLVGEAYDAMMIEQLTKGRFVACKGELLDYQNENLIVYFKSTGNTDQVWNRITSWFGMWGLGNGGAQRGITRGIVTFSFATNRVYLVGSASPLVKKIPKFAKERPLEIIDANTYEDGFGSHSCRQQPIFFPKVDVIVAREGQTCTDACEKQQKKCVIEYLPHLNYCAALQEHTGCQTCKVIERPNFALPSIVSENDSDFFDCCYSYHEKWLTCDAVPAPKVKRVCTCL